MIKSIDNIDDDIDNIKLFYWKDTNYTIPYQIYIDNNFIKINDINNYEDLQKICDSNNIEYRINESIIPIDFNIDIYKKLNKDLQNMTNQEAFIHYINNGYYENRKYKLYENLLNFTDKIM